MTQDTTTRQAPPRPAWPAYPSLDYLSPDGSLPQSGFGIAAAVVTALTALCLVVTLVTGVWAVIRAETQGGSIPLEGLFSTMACAGLLTAPLAVVGLLLGLAGCNRKDRRRRLGALAVLVNGLAILFLVLGFLAWSNGPYRVIRTSPYGLVGS